MPIFPRTVSRFLLSVIAMLALPVLAQQPAPGPDLSSPRATFETFLGSMRDAHQGDRAALDAAIAALDLSDVPSIVREEAGPKAANDLKNYLDRLELIEIDRIPTEIAGDRWVYRKGPAGEVSLVRQEDGEWLFSAKTIDALPGLLDSVRGKAFVTGTRDPGGAPQSMADWVRGKVPESMQGRVFLLEYWQWVGLLILIFVGVVADWLLRIVSGIWLRKLLSRSEKLRAKEMDASFLRPIGLIAMAVTWRLLLPVLDLPIQALTALKFAAQLIVAAASVWAAYRLVDLVAAHLIARARGTDTKVDDILIPMGRRALKILVVAFGVLFVAQNLDIDVTSLLAGLGLGGLAFALAAKDTVENLFGSVTVLIDRPLQVGDWVVIGGDLEGTVEQIGFRSTRVRTFYNSLITVPNSNLVNTAVDNLGVRKYRRVKCMIGVQYDTPPEKIEAFCEGIRELIRKHPYTRKDYYMVYFNQFADSSLNILLYAFHETPDWATELRERHRLFVDIVRLAKALGVEFAFPTRTLHLASAPAGLAAQPEPASPPHETGPAPDGVGFHEDAVRLGRAEAEAIMESMWKDEIQPPVNFADPDRILPE
jgi:MscS family membrane protein